MNPACIVLYFANTIWLLVPILKFNIFFVKFLPPAYQIDVFGRNIPTWIGVPENLLRFSVFLLPQVMRPEISNPSQKLGL